VLDVFVKKLLENLLIIFFCFLVRILQRYVYFTATIPTLR